MITYEQIKWTTSVFKEIGTILDMIPDFRSYYFLRDECLSQLEYHLKNGNEFFFNEDDGLYKIKDDDRGQFTHEVFGKTKKEIIRHVVDRSILDDASLCYAAKRFWEEHPNTPLPCNPDNDFFDQYHAYVNERICFCHSIVDPYIDLVEDNAYPHAPYSNPLKLIKQGKNILLFTKEDSYIAKVDVLNPQIYVRFYLGVLHEECGQDYGSWICLDRERTSLDISFFIGKAKYLSLEAETTVGKDRVLLERLEIDLK